jgi:hypothetical protein
MPANSSGGTLRFSEYLRPQHSTTRLKRGILLCTVMAILEITAVEYTVLSTNVRKVMPGTCKSQQIPLLSPPSLLPRKL